MSYDFISFNRIKSWLLSLQGYEPWLPSLLYEGGSSFIDVFLFRSKIVFGRNRNIIYFCFCFVFVFRKTKIEQKKYYFCVIIIFFVFVLFLFLEKQKLNKNKVLFLCYYASSFVLNCFYLSRSRFFSKKNAHWPRPNMQ